jgi:branched-chain amino acid transport system permease protein
VSAAATGVAGTGRPGLQAGAVLRTVGWLALLGVLVYLPQTYEAVQVKLFIDVLCLAFAAIGLNLLTGFSGLISVGHGAFFGLGAYTTAILVAEHGWSHPAALVASAVAAFALGVLVGLPALRIKGLYLALVTLALATLFPEFVKRFSDVTGGTQGLRVPKVRAPDWTGLDDDQWQYYVILTLLVIAFVLVRNLVKSRVGRALIASRDNETAAETMGVNLALYRVVTFGISAMLAGIGGALLVWKDNFVDPGQFGINLSITILVAVVVGGAATLLGPPIGAFFVTFLPEWIPKQYPELSPVIFGGSLILLMMVAPGGVMGLARRAEAWLRRRVADRGSAAAPPGQAPDALASRP